MKIVKEAIDSDGEIGFKVVGSYDEDDNEKRRINTVICNLQLSIASFSFASNKLSTSWLNAVPL